VTDRSAAAGGGDRGEGRDDDVIADVIGDVVGDIGPIEALVCDLDGVVYRGPAAVPHAVEVLRSVTVPIRYATNNASRTPDAVAEHLRSLGLDVKAADVITSAQAGAAAIAERLPGARVLAIGGEGVHHALLEAGLETTSRSDGADAVLQGYGSRVCAADLAEAAYAVRAGAWWVATNTDTTLPSDRGLAPGNGALIRAVELATGRSPDRVCGKPSPDLYLVASDSLGIEPARILAVGDRLDTDVEGANAAGMPSVLVLTGVADRAAVRTATPAQRPSLIIDDLRGLPGVVPTSTPRALG